MLQSFFPMPKKFFSSAVAWSLAAIFLWYFGGKELGTAFGLQFPDKDANPVIGLGHFATDDFIWFYLYYSFFTLIFYGFWVNYAPHKWQLWSILGSALILFFTYFQVQVAVAVNNWYRPFYDAIQNALSNESTTAASDLYGYMFSFLILAMTYVLFSVLTSFFVSHYIFRWRTAMNDYYTERWKLVRHIEGASQRIQEDTMRFASIMKTKGLILFFTIVVYFLSIYLLFLKEKAQDTKPNFNILPKIIFGFISGFVSAPMGIGGAVMNVPILKYFGYPINKAIGSAAAIGFFIALFGAFGFLISGSYLDVDLPLSIGFINIPALLIFIPITTVMAKIGANAVHKIEKQKITKFFGIFLLVVGTIFLYRYINI